MADEAEAARLEAEARDAFEREEIDRFVARQRSAPEAAADSPAKADDADIDAQARSLLRARPQSDVRPQSRDLALQREIDEEAAKRGA